MRIRRRPLQLAAGSAPPLSRERPGRAGDAHLTCAASSDPRPSEKRAVAGFHNSAAARTDVGLIAYAGSHFNNRGPYDDTTHNTFLSQRQRVGRLLLHMDGVRQTACKINQYEDQHPLLQLPLSDQRVRGFETSAKPQNESEELMDGKCLISKLISSVKGKGSLQDVSLIPTFISHILGKVWQILPHLIQSVAMQKRRKKKHYAGEEGETWGDFSGRRRRRGLRRCRTTWKKKTREVSHDVLTIGGGRTAEANPAASNAHRTVLLVVYSTRQPTSAIQ